MSAPTRQRFPIRRDLAWRPLLVAFGLATSDRSYVETDDGLLHIRFGVFFDEMLLLGDIADVEEQRRHFFDGIGWRTNFRGRIALVGSTGGIVRIRLAARRRLHFVFPFWRMGVDTIDVSLEDPRGFIATIATSTS